MCIRFLFALNPLFHPLVKLLLTGLLPGVLTSASLGHHRGRHSAWLGKTRAVLGHDSEFILLALCKSIYCSRGLTAIHLNTLVTKQNKIIHKKEQDQ